MIGPESQRRANAAESARLAAKAERERRAENRRRAKVLREFRQLAAESTHFGVMEDVFVDEVLDLLGVDLSPIPKRR